MSKEVRENGSDEWTEENPELLHDDEGFEAEPSAAKQESDETAALSKLQAELDEQKDKYLRLAAEFDNFRKRTAKDMFELRQTAAKDLMISLLEVLDDVDRAEAQIRETEDRDELLEGVLLIFSKFRKTLEQRGLRPIETMYTEFDVEKDEAISEMPVDDEKLKGKVVAEVQKGYMLNDKLIRYAKVVVGR